MTDQAALPALSSLCGAASLTAKASAERNEDMACLLMAPDSTCCGVAVADGVGGHENGGEAARIAVEEVASRVRVAAPESAEDLLDLFSQVRQHLRDEVAALPVPPVNLEAAYGTTLLVAVETPTRLIAAYTGNGAILHLRGDFDEAITAGRPPWGAANYLRPHTVGAGGQDSLYNLVAPAEELSMHPPTVITINKDARFGDVLLLCTDGIFSAEQTLYGTDRDGNRWLAVEKRLTSFYDRLVACFASACAPCEQPSLSDCLQAYLFDLDQRQLLDDDATVGLIITGQARGFQRQRQRPKAGTA